MNGESGLGNGTSGSPQTTFENTEAEHKAAENEQRLYLEVELPKSSPIPIPKEATITETHKKAGYDQVAYKWNDGNYTYTARWHTHTPNAPKYSQNTWVVERVRSGIGAGKNVRPKIHEVYVKNKGWVSWEKWDAAKKARKYGSETKEQRELLDDGHWQA